MDNGFLTADASLAQQTEAAEAANGFALAAGATGSMVVAEALAGGCALFAGVGSPLTHALGIGMAGPVSEQEFDRLEAFFRERGSAVLIDLCPMADLSVIEQVTRRGYQVLEFNNLMLRRISPGDAAEPPRELRIVAAGQSRHAEWCHAVLRGFNGTLEVAEESVALLQALPSYGETLFAESAEGVCGTAAMAVHNAVAMFYADATMAAARRRGVQAALIRYRLAAAAAREARWAMACVIPGSASHRNYERAGFELFYMRVNLIREWN